MKIAVIIPYFGKFPANINTFLYSASYNDKINWMIFTDQPTRNLLSVKNVEFIQTTLRDIQKRIQSIVGSKIVLNTPYKLCDYKPLYGRIFADYLKNYDYWGYGDMDVVYGNLMKFILPGIKENYDRIGDLGHFTLYKNTFDINNRYLLTCKDRHGKLIHPFDRVYKHSRGYAFDELGMRAIYQYHHFSTYINQDLVTETKTGRLDLVSIDPRFSNLEGAFIWSKGRCLYYYQDPRLNCLRVHEFGYFHFLKRHRFTSFLDRPTNCFGISTNGYHRLKSVNDESIKKIMTINHSGYVNRLMYMIHSYFFSGDITFRKVLGIHLPFFELYQEIKKHTFKI